MPKRKRPRPTTSRRQAQSTPASQGRQGKNPSFSGIFGAGFKAFRKRQGVTQAAIGRMSGVSDSAVGEWEAGRSSPTIVQLAQIAAGLGVPLTTLVSVVMDEAAAYRKTLSGCMDRLEKTIGTLRTLTQGEALHEEKIPRLRVSRKKLGKMA